VTSYELSLYLIAALMSTTVVGTLVAAFADIARIGRTPATLLCPWCDHDHAGSPCTVRIYLARHA
jgi:hypothetical protein